MPNEPEPVANVLAHYRTHLQPDSVLALSHSTADQDVPVLAAWAQGGIYAYAGPPPSPQRDRAGIRGRCWATSSSSRPASSTLCTGRLTTRRPRPPGSTRRPAGRPGSSYIRAAFARSVPVSTGSGGALAHPAGQIRMIDLYGAITSAIRADPGTASRRTT